MTWGECGMAVCNDTMYREMQGQGSALRGLLADAASLTIEQRPARRIVTTGCGDGAIVGDALTPVLRHLAAPAEVVPVYASTASYWLDLQPGDVLIASSVSGETGRTVEAAQRAAAAGAEVVAVTAGAQSSLARAAGETVLLTHLAASVATPHTINYTSTMAAIAWYVARRFGADTATIERLPDAVDAGVARGEAAVRSLPASLFTAGRTVFLGAGPHFATARYGAEKLWSAGGFNACAFDLEDVFHGAHLTLRPGDLVVAIAPGGRTRQRADAVLAGARELGMETLLVTTASGGPVAGGFDVVFDDAVDEEWSPFVTHLALQWLCWRWAAERAVDVVTKEGGEIPDPQRWNAVHRALARS